MGDCKRRWVGDSKRRWVGDSGGSPAAVPPLPPPLLARPAAPVARAPPPLRGFVALLRSRSDTAHPTERPALCPARRG